MGQSQVWNFDLQTLCRLHSEWFWKGWNSVNTAHQADQAVLKLFSGSLQLPVTLRLEIKVGNCSMLRDSLYCLNLWEVTMCLCAAVIILWTRCILSALLPHSGGDACCFHHILSTLMNTKPLYFPCFSGALCRRVLWGSACGPMGLWCWLSFLPKMGNQAGIENCWGK